LQLVSCKINETETTRMCWIRLQFWNLTFAPYADYADYAEILGSIMQ